MVRYNFVDNAYLRGPNSGGALAFRESNPIARAWFEGNSMDGVVPADPWTLVSGRDDRGYRLDGPAPMPAVAREPADRALTRVLSQAGASRRRDAVDARIVQSVRERSGQLINSQEEVGGWPELARGTPWRDGDGDGLPDDWERQQALDPGNPADAASDRDGDGYSALEAWLDALAREAAATR